METLNTAATIVGVFDSVQDARNAIEQLESQGFSRDEISLVANKESTGYDRLSDSEKGEVKDKTANVATDAGIGAAIGGVGGLLLSIAGVAIPGIGAVLAAGPIVAALTGAGIGAAGGGIIGALTESGVPESDANLYAESVRRGDVLVTVRAEGARAERACDILDRNGAVDVDERSSNWRSRGWTGSYDTNAQPYSRDELTRERSYYGSSMAGATGYMDDETRTSRSMDSGYDRQEDTGRGSSIARETDRAGNEAQRAGHRMSEGGEKLAHRAEEGLKKAGHRIEEGWDKMTGDRDRHADKLANRADEAAQKVGHRAEETGDQVGNRAKEWKYRSRLYR